MALRFKRVPRHIGIIPDGNRRWAVSHGFSKEKGYAFGVKAAQNCFKQVFALNLGIDEVSAYAFTHENTLRSKIQVAAFQAACTKASFWMKRQDISFLIVGDTSSPLFPRSLLKFTVPDADRDEKKKVNFLVNYSWRWDLGCAAGATKSDMLSRIGSKDVSRIDLIIRWGNRRRLSGFLPLQSAYADLFVVDKFWPEFHIDDFYRALRWYEQQDVTHGG